MEIKTEIIPSKEELIRLYDDVGWTAYTDDPDLLVKAIKNSLKVWTLWDGEDLIGLARTVGDGATICYVQDLLILEAYQGEGLGSKLLDEIKRDNADIRQFVLLTEDIEKNRNFYKKLGLIPVSDADCISFMW